MTTKATTSWNLGLRLERNCLFIAVSLLSIFMVLCNEGRATAPEWLLAYQTELRYYQHGKFVEAIGPGELALHGVIRQLGCRHLNVAIASQTLGKAYLNAGRSDRAIPLLQQSINVYMLQKKRNLDTILDSYSNIIEAYRAAKHLDLALRASQEARLLTPSGTNQSAVANFSVGINMIDLERFRDGLPYMEEAYRIKTRTDPQNSTELALIENNLALIYLEIGRLDDSERLYAKCLATRERIDRASAPATLASLAELYHQRGDLDKAVAYGLRAIDESRQVHEPTVLTARKQSNLSVFYVQQHKYGDAEALLTDAMNSIDDGSNPDLYAYVLGNLGSLYHSEGRFDESVALGKRSYEIKRKYYGDRAVSTAIEAVNIAGDYIRLGDFGAAEDFLNRAYPVLANASGKNLYGLAALFEARTLAAKKTLRYDDEVTSARLLLETREKQYGRNNIDVANTKVMLALALIDQGTALDEAETLILSAIRTAGSSADPRGQEFHTSWQGALARLYLKKHLFDKALSAIDECLANDCAEIDPGLDVIVAASAQGLISQEKAYTKAVALIRNGDVSVTALTLMKTRNRYRDNDEALEALIRKKQDIDLAIKAAAKRYGEKILNAGTPESIDSRRRLSADLDALQASRKSTDLSIQQQFPKYATLASLVPTDAHSIQAALRPDEAFIAVWTTTSGVFALAATAAQCRVIKLDVTKSDFDREAIALRGSLEPGEGNAFDMRDAHLLYQQIFGPIDDLAGSKKRWAFFANGAITSLPIQTLAMTASGDDSSNTHRPIYVVERHIVTVLPTIDGLKSLYPVEAAADQKAMIGFGNPIFKRSASPAAVRNPVIGEGGRVADWNVLSAGLSSLPETEIELRDVAATLGSQRTDLYVKERATVSQIKAIDLSRYRIVYFATHGLLAGDVAKYAKIDAEPALAMSVPAEPSIQDDGLLKASDVTQLRLNADLVVLSACNTASGDHAGAQAMSGLAQSFFYAGARSVVVSHWPVSSESTVRLMANLFKFRGEGPDISTAQALQESSLEVMNDPQHPEWKNPVYWAPFVVVANGNYR